jgi:hypothetical protein
MTSRNLNLFGISFCAFVLIVGVVAFVMIMAH